MVTKVTEGIKISVVTAYKPFQSHPKGSAYFFYYTISIENCSANTVKLLRRHWYIYNALGLVHEVEGIGVVGEQPVLRPGELHRYSSGCEIITEIGKMHGTYLMENQLTLKRFNVSIPEFKLVVPYILN